MVEGYYRIVVEELRALGFGYLGNAKGSHEKWRRAEGPTLIVPRSMKSRHTANAVLKAAGSVKRV